MGNYLLSGTMLRVALQEGYHRDSSQFPGLTVFQSEMRRRVWSAVSQHDVTFSVYVGLPKSTRYSESDTLPPRNLHEYELFENMTELPPSRPLTEDTEVSYQIVKWHLMRACERVIESVHIIDPQPYEEVLKTDLMLLDFRQMIPPHLQLGTLEEVKDDLPSRILEKKYWDGAPLHTNQDTYHYSRKTSVVASIALLGHQVTMHQASQPGGPLANFKWYSFGITNHDFLLAAIILCLDLSSIRKAGRPDVPECPFTPDIDKLAAIKKSHAIWQDIVDDCPDARRAVKILTAVLAKLSTKYWNITPTPPIPNKKGNTATEEVSTSAQNSNVDTLRYNPYFTDQFGLGFSLRDHPTDAIMQDSFLDSMATDLTVGDFNWYCTSGISSWQAGNEV